MTGWRADVDVDATSDHLLVRPRAAAEAVRILGELRKPLVGHRLTKSAHGISLPLHAAADLYDQRELIAGLKWTRTALQFASNRSRARRSYERILEQIQELRKEGLKGALKCLPARTDVRVLDDHQLVNVAAMALPGGFGMCLFDEQGAGKTVSFIFAFDLLAARNEADLALIIAPKSMVPEWPEDFRRFRGDLYKVAMITGTRRQKLEAIRSGADVLITNFETALSLEPELTAALARRGGRAVLAVDESFFVKNLGAARTQAVKRLREWCGRAFVLCGTPAPNAPDDLLQQFAIVDFGLTFHGVDIPDDRNQALAMLRGVLARRGLYMRNLKSEALPDLPERTFNEVIVRMQPIQRAFYVKAVNDLFEEARALDSVGFKKQITSFLAKRQALLQLCSTPSSVVSGLRETPAKIVALDELLHELIVNRREKVVIWSFYTKAIDEIVARYPVYRPVRYDGAVADVETRRKAVSDFQTDDETMLFVANPAAAGAGLTLHRARYAIYESMSNQAAHYLQSLDRIHRRGQTREVEYIVLLCEESIEIVEYQRLLRKRDRAHELLGDEVAAPRTRESFISELEQLRRLVGQASSQSDTSLGA